MSTCNSTPLETENTVWSLSGPQGRQSWGGFKDRAPNIWTCLVVYSQGDQDECPNPLSEDHNYEGGKQKKAKNFITFMLRYRSARSVLRIKILKMHHFFRPRPRSGPPPRGNLRLFPRPHSQLERWIPPPHSHPTRCLRRLVLGAYGAFRPPILTTDRRHWSVSVSSSLVLASVSNAVVLFAGLSFSKFQWLKHVNLLT